MLRNLLEAVLSEPRELWGLPRVDEISQGSIDALRGPLSAELGIPQKYLEIRWQKRVWGSQRPFPMLSFADRRLSPRHNTGWYGAFMFDAKGRAAFLAVLAPHPRLTSRGRRIVEPLISQTEGVEVSISLGDSGAPNDRYEKCTVVAKRYEKASVPDDGVLSRDLLVFARLLKAIYRSGEVDLGVAPSEANRRRPSELTDRRAVLRALSEFDELGRGEFLAKYGFSPARTYSLEWNGQEYDSKAILGAAYGFQHGTPLSPQEFSGGEATTAPVLRRLGFSVVARSGRVSTDRESVEKALEIAASTGRDQFLDAWNQRDASKFEIAWNGASFPAKAILAVAEALHTGEPVRAAGDWRGSRASVAEPLIALGFDVRANAERYEETKLSLSLEPSPPLRVREATPPPDRGTVRVPARDHLSGHQIRSEIGQAGELAVVELEISRLMAEGREDLAAQVVQVSDPEVGGDGAGYDISSFDSDGFPLFIEVKTTVKEGARTPFYLSAGERRFYQSHRDAYRVYRLYGFSVVEGSGRYFVLTAEDLDRIENEPTDFIYRP